MNFKSLFRYVTGILIVIVIIAGLVIYRDYKSSFSPSTSSEVVADVISLGVEYPGLITNMLVNKGEDVKKGQVLGYFKSTVLINQLTEAKITPRDLVYPLTDKSELALVAAKDGTVQDISYQNGSFVPGNKEIFSILDNNSKYVISRHLLSPNDLRLVNRNHNLAVKLFDGQVVNLQIRKIEIVPKGSNYLVTIESKPTNSQSFHLIEIGTPLQARLILKDQTLWATLTERAGELYARVVNR